jgi:hypothetical protein
MGNEHVQHLAFWDHTDSDWWKPSLKKVKGGRGFFPLGRKTPSKAIEREP